MKAKICIVLGGESLASHKMNTVADPMLAGINLDATARELWSRMTSKFGGVLDRDPKTQTFTVYFSSKKNIQCLVDPNFTWPGFVSSLPLGQTGWELKSFKDKGEIDEAQPKPHLIGIEYSVLGYTPQQLARHILTENEQNLDSVFHQLQLIETKFYLLNDNGSQLKSQLNGPYYHQFVEDSKKPPPKERAIPPYKGEVMDEYLKSLEKLGYTEDESPEVRSTLLDNILPNIKMINYIPTEKQALIVLYHHPIFSKERNYTETAKNINAINSFFTSIPPLLSRIKKNPVQQEAPKWDLCETKSQMRIREEYQKYKFDEAKDLLEGNPANSFGADYESNDEKGFLTPKKGSKSPILW